MSKNSLMKTLNSAKKFLDGKLVVLWGIGNTTRLYAKDIAMLYSEGINIAYYTVSDSSKWGQTFAGKLIIPPQKLKELESVFVIICSMNPQMTSEIKDLLTEMGIENDSIDKVIFSRHSGEVIECFDMLEDAESKRVYFNLIKARMDVVNPPQNIVSPDQYYSLPQFSAEDENEILVECGAYIGDTIEAYVRKKNGKFGKIISFEPDPDNMFKAQQTALKLLDEFHLEKNKIILYPFAVGDKEEKVFIESSQTNRGSQNQVVPLNAQGKISNDKCIETVVLDNFLITPYSFLKADVEGYEQNILLGAKKGIKQYKPLLAICIYHSAMDFYKIPILIKEILPEYKLAVRHHSKTLSETVIYAYIKDNNK